MKIGIVGQGAFGKKHLAALSKIEDVEVVTLVGGNQEATKAVADEFGIRHFTGRLSEGLAQPGLEAMILASPTHLHAEQAVDCMLAGKHVQIEIPMTDTVGGAQNLCALQKGRKLVGMVGHTRHFSPAHLEVIGKLRDGDKLYQLQVTSYFQRRENINLKGQPRSWFDHLLWHHAAHTVALFSHATGQRVVRQEAFAGPFNEEMQTQMDMGILLQSEGGAVCVLSLSFNHTGKQGTHFRYICQSGEYVCYYDDLFNGDGELLNHFPADSGVEAQDREFIAAIREGRQPQASFAEIFPTMEVLAKLSQLLEG